jgi:type IV pilus assembly protein PilC
MMIKSGINVEKSVSILLEDTSSEADLELLSQILSLIEEGYSLSRALDKVGRFPSHMVCMIDIGQITGKLEAVLTSLSNYYRREANVSKLIRNAVLYPAVMLVGTAVILFVLVSQVLPVFEQVFSDMGAGITATVSVLLDIGSVSKVAAMALSCLFVLAVVVAALLNLSPGGKQIISNAVDGVFFGNKLNLALARSRFSSAMSLMLSSGLNISESLDRSGKLIGQGVFTNRINNCRDRIDDGTTFPKAAEETGIFSKMQSGLLSAGFRSGITEQAMNEVARLCENDSDAMLMRMVNKVEPTLIVIMALSVGLVLLSVMLPLIGMMSAIGV